MTVRRFVRIRLLVSGVAVAGVSMIGVGSAGAAQPPVGLGAATSFAVLAGQTVTNTGPSVITGDLGVSPGSAVTGFPPGLVNGVIHVADAVANLAQTDLTDSYNDAAGRIPVTSVGADLSGMVLVAGVYGGPTLGLTGTVTLDAQGDPNAVFVFQSASTLITASSSVVSFINGADPCNVYWQVGSSATLGTGSTFVGTIMALTSISAETAATITGRLLARNGAVTLDSNVITAPGCAVLAPTTTTTAAPTTTAAATTVPDTGPASTVAVPTTTPPVPASQPTRITLPVTGSRTGEVATAGAAVLVAGVLTLIVLARMPRRRRGI
ncbi:MAG: hypothetical protein JWM12_2557 [Ilumatobacteraceae bacterium]|nr:hypothetical protein [Ilumatobacteraceae bacterium]